MLPVKIVAVCNGCSGNVCNAMVVIQCCSAIAVLVGSVEPPDLGLSSQAVIFKSQSAAETVIDSGAAIAPTIKQH